MEPLNCSQQLYFTACFFLFTLLSQQILLVQKKKAYHCYLLEFKQKSLKVAMPCFMRYSSLWPFYPHSQNGHNTLQKVKTLRLQA